MSPTLHCNYRLLMQFFNFFTGDEDEDEIAAIAEHYRLMALIEEKPNDNDMDQNDQ